MNKNLSIINKKTQKALTKIPVLHPANQLLTFWDVIHSVFIVLCMFYLPISYFLWQKEDFYQTTAIEPYLITSFGVFICDILLNLNTGYYEDGQCIMNRIKILKHYGINNLWIDFLSLVSFSDVFFAINKYLRFLNLFIFLKFFKIY